MKGLVGLRGNVRTFLPGTRQYRGATILVRALQGFRLRRLLISPRIVG